MGTTGSVDGLKSLLRSTGADILRAISEGKVPDETDVVRFRAFLDVWSALTTEEEATDLDHASRFLKDAITDLQPDAAG